MQKREKVYNFLHKSTDFWLRNKKDMLNLQIL